MILQQEDGKDSTSEEPALAAKSSADLVQTAQNGTKSETPRTCLGSTGSIKD